MFNIKNTTFIKYKNSFALKNYQTSYALVTLILRIKYKIKAIIRIDLQNISN